MKSKLYSRKGKPIVIVGISSSKRRATECAREDPISLFYLKVALSAASRAGAKTILLDLRDMKIGACKGCYSTCPAQCRFSEKEFLCDCYMFNSDHFFINDKTVVPIEKAYDILTKKDFFKIYNDEGRFAERDDMWMVYRALIEADGVIFAGSTQYHSRPPLLQTMFSRLTALDGGVEKLFGDGKNLRNSIAYSKNPGSKYKQRLYGKWCAFINTSKEGDDMSPTMMKACSMMGMKIMPFGTANRVNWYNDPTHRSDSLKSKRDEYTIYLAKHIGTEMVTLIRGGPREYGLSENTV